MTRELDKEIKNTAYIEKGIRVIAYCSNCHTPIFRGGSKTPIEQHVLRRSVFDHSEFFRGEHDISIVYLHRSENSIVAADDFLFSTTETSIDEGLQRIADTKQRLL